MGQGVPCGFELRGEIIDRIGGDQNGGMFGFVGEGKTYQTDPPVGFGASQQTWTS